MFIPSNLEEDPDISEIYWRAEQKCRKYTKKITSYFFINEAIFLGAPLFSFYCILTGNTDASTWALPFDLSVPFDTNTILGWYLTWFFQFNISLCYVSCTITITTYFVCCCIYLAAICEHFGFLFDSVAEDVERNRGETIPMKHRKRKRTIEEKMGKIVATHAKVFE